MCNYITRTGNKCKRDGNYKIKKEQYCKRHYEQLMKQNTPTTKKTPSKKIKEVQTEKQPEEIIHLTISDSEPIEEKPIENKNEHSKEQNEENKPKLSAIAEYYLNVIKSSYN